MPRNSFESYILAGGKSTRMKRDKAFLELGGKTLLERAVETLRAVESPKISVSVAAEPENPEIYPPEIRLVPDIYKNCGTLGGIHAALAACRSKYALVVACDYPFVSVKFLLFLLAEAEKSPAGAVAPVQLNGIIQPLCAVYEAEKCLDALTVILENFRRTPAARDFIRRINAKLIAFEEFAGFPNAENFFLNVNTPEDLERAQDMIRTGGF
jgi:molybdopterin-guanine dinucleotide biosynthesis protein A